MSGAEQAGANNRRLTEAEEQRAAEMFAEGASESEVATALGCSRSTAHRLRERLQDAAGGAEEAGTAGTAADLESRLAGATFTMRLLPEGGAVVTDPAAGLGDEVDDAVRGELLAQLGERREDLSARLAAHCERAAASRQAVSGLEAERLRLLGEGKDAAPLRQRRRDAEADLADSETAADLVRAELAAVDARIGEVQREGHLAGLRAQLAAAVAGRDAAVRATGGRMRAAVLAVRDAAVEFAAALTDEKLARERAELLAGEVSALAGELGQPGPDVPAEPASTVPLVPEHHRGAGGGLAFARAVQAATTYGPGGAQRVAVQLAEMFGYLPPSREEQEAEREHWLRMNAGREPQRPQVQAAGLRAWSSHGR